MFQHQIRFTRTLHENQMTGENHLAVRQDQTQLMLLYPLLACCKLELSG